MSSELGFTPRRHSAAPPRQVHRPGAPRGREDARRPLLSLPIVFSPAQSLFFFFLLPPAHFPLSAQIGAPSSLSPSHLPPRGRRGLRESGRCTPLHAAPWSARQGSPTSPINSACTTPLASPYRSRRLANPSPKSPPPLEPRSSSVLPQSRRSAARSPPQAASGAPHCGENIYWSPSPLPLAPVHARSLTIALPSNLAVERALRHV